MDLEVTGFVGMDDQFRKETLLQQVHPMHRAIADQIDLQQPQATYGEFFNCLLDRVGVRDRPDDIQAQGYLSFRPQRFNRQRPRSFSRGRSTERKPSSSDSGAQRGTSKGRKFTGRCHICHKVGHMKRDCRLRKKNSYTAKTKDSDEESYAAYVGIYQPEPYDLPADSEWDYDSTDGEEY